MVTCRECINFENCLNDKQQTRYYGEDVACGNADELCRYFLPKSDYVKRERGEWHLLDECANEGVYCSVCHKKVYKVSYANQKIKSNYCPNCGADMRKEDNNNE